jgi:hypothetical protein
MSASKIQKDEYVGLSENLSLETRNNSNLSNGMTASDD